MLKKLNISELKPHIVLEPVADDDIHFIRCRILIVCEGEKTEPNYFHSFAMMKNPSQVVWKIDCGGGGINTMKVVDAAIDMKNKADSAGTPYDSVWAVFDRDSFKACDFDNAIAKAAANGIDCAWSNEAFELWYIYHFDARCTPMGRKEYKKFITKRVREAGYKEGTKLYVYKKNDQNMRQILSLCHCDENRAISNAELQASTFTDHKFSTHNPCSMVYKLVRLLTGGDKEFNTRIKKEIEKK